jgi:hypothetical protein
LVFSDLILKKVTPYVKVFFQAVYDSINLERMVGSLGDLMQDNVNVSYRNIIPDETLTFEHIGGGKFWSKLNNQPISQPSGSQRAAISFGVMVTLAKQFGLPLIMDEAADRFDVDRLANFLDLARRVAIDTDEEKGLQICLALYRTRDVTAEDLTTANTYEIQRKSNIEKIILPYEQD